MAMAREGGVYMCLPIWQICRNEVMFLAPISAAQGRGWDLGYCIQVPLAATGTGREAAGINMLA